jgi:predicted nucleic acid-binding protein
MNSMSDKCFVDTNLLVYAHDRSAGVKQDRAIELVDRLWKEKRGVISSQVLQEFAVASRRNVLIALSRRDVIRIIDDLRDWEIVLNNTGSVIGALEIEERYQISFWDALILQAAQSAKVAILYTEDLSDGQRFGSVRVVNPFKN